MCSVRCIFSVCAFVCDCVCKCTRLHLCVHMCVRVSVYANVQDYNEGGREVTDDISVMCLAC